MSSIVETSSPTAEPVDVSTAKQMLRLSINDNSDDSFISSVIIPGARRHLESLLGLTLANRNFVQSWDSFPQFPFFQSAYASLFGAAFPFYFGYGPIAGYPYPAIGGLQGQAKPYVKSLGRSPVTAIDHIEYQGTDGEAHGLVPGKDFVVDFASIPGRIAPVPGQRWPIGIGGSINAVRIYYTAGYQPPGAGLVSPFDGAIWQPLTVVPQNSYVFDSGRNVQLQLVSGGKTGKTEPTWATIAGNTVSDGVAPNPATWKNLGPVIGEWAANTNYTAPAVVSDPNGNLQQLVVSSLTSGGSAPTWAITRGLMTIDNSQSAWMNIGVDQSEGATDPADQFTNFSYNVAIPDHFYVALLQLIVHWYQNRDVIITSAGAGGAHVPLPLHLQSIIDAERVLNFEVPD